MNTVTYNATITTTKRAKKSQGRFTTLHDRDYYLIENIDTMSPFFMSIVSSGNHWLFISSNGGLSIGRVSSDYALFPYTPVDKIEHSAANTGSKTILKITHNDESHMWEPFSSHAPASYAISRNLYKGVYGDTICFEEVHTELQITFRYHWSTSTKNGFIRTCELINNNADSINIELLDGLQNIMPASVPGVLQERASNLVDAYKWCELDPITTLAHYSIYAGISDKPEPVQSLRANTVYSLGVDSPTIYLSSTCIDDFITGIPLQPTTHTRGVRGAYFIHAHLKLKPKISQQWYLVADVNNSQDEIIQLQRSIPALTTSEITHNIMQDAKELLEIMGKMDGLQLTNEQIVTTHHFANVVFNSMRGGIVRNNYTINSYDFARHIKHFNKSVHHFHEALLTGLPRSIDRYTLLARVSDTKDNRLLRLYYEYLPITFGRRHGDPSRPWNTFTINVKDKQHNPILSYEGNWRDIFQNWEALLLSYPEFSNHVISRFVNASTIDGCNPYRLNKEGIDWEVEDKDDPWSYIGYWGDHQIIYLLKLLELSYNTRPDALLNLLDTPIFSYANVPYRIKSFNEIIANPKNTIIYDYALAKDIDKNCLTNGADAKMLQHNDDVYLVTLREKLLVPLLTKISNLVIGGGIWLNTQRPEWNDANNALVGGGLSMVTLYYMRRYTTFMSKLFADAKDISISQEVASWMAEISTICSYAAIQITKNTLSSKDIFTTLTQLGHAATTYRDTVYSSGFSATTTVNSNNIQTLLTDTQLIIDYSIAQNSTTNGLYHSYNLLNITDKSLSVDRLYLMLEGQVAVLSSGALSTEQACTLLESLFASNLYRDDQHTFILYPDRELPRLLEKNIISYEQICAISGLQQIIKRTNKLIICDTSNTYRFQADIITTEVLQEVLRSIVKKYSNISLDTKAIMVLYKQVFEHKTFTGRSGVMFGFEGLGCIYWHMVAKLLLATQEVFFQAVNTSDANKYRLAHLYYKVRGGIGFNKTPQEYGAFPADPYSHTTKHSGAQQPGMTGQVKEEILSRFGELGARTTNGKLSFMPYLLRLQEFISTAQNFKYIDVNDVWHILPIPPCSIAFTLCQVPIIYTVDNARALGITITLSNGDTMQLDSLTLSRELSSKIFGRTGYIKTLSIIIHSNILHNKL